jgi:polysaccharide biosynthesis protein PelC
VKARTVVSLVMVLALTAGGGGARVFVPPDIDLSYYERAGVVPFLATGGDQAAAASATSAFTTELLIAGGYELAEPGDFSVLAAKVIGGSDLLKAQPLRSEQVRTLADSAHVQAVFEGVVRTYEMARVGSGSYPLISIEVRMIDAETGKLLWTGTETRRGGPGFPIFGWGVIPTLGELTREVCRSLAREVPR